MLKKIFDFIDNDETHYKLILFGIKIKFTKPKYIKIKRQNPYNEYVKNNIDITSIPPAEGLSRSIQLANLALLKELDYVCEQNHLQYWLDFGSMLGAIRHKGFIPWDDDIDVGMLRDDYENIVEVFNKDVRNKDLYASFVRNEKNPALYYIKILHKKCSYLFVDIFPYDIYGDILTEAEQLKQSKRMKKTHKRLRDSVSSDTLDSDLKIKIQNLSEKLLPKKNIENSDLVWGIDFGHGWKNWFSRYDVIFPLKKISFENTSFPCVNKPEEYLKRVYGNYMSYPKSFFGHAVCLNLSDSEKSVIEDLARSV